MTPSSTLSTSSSTLIPTTSTTTTHKPNQYEGIEQNTSGLNNSAKAGIGVAGGIAAVILFSAIGMNVVSLRRRRKRRKGRRRRVGDDNNGNGVNGGGEMEDGDGESTEESRVNTVELGGKARRELGMRGSEGHGKKVGSQRKVGVEEVGDINGRGLKGQNNDITQKSAREMSKLPSNALYPPASPHLPPLSPPPSSPLPSPPVEAHSNNHRRNSRSRSRSRDGRNGAISQSGIQKL